MRNYKKFNVWWKSHELVLMIYKDIAPGFPISEKFSLANQLKRAAYSVPFNIVEGCGRNTDKDFAHFLDMSLGSAQEVEYCLLLAKDLAFINDGQYQILYEKVNGIKAMIINLIKRVRGFQALDPNT
ncbi:MAG TPA: four helix bundle protein [Puia sp.]